jgi:nicotinamidase/pyrazinamidase
MAEALVVVDFQNDFSPGGALAVPDGDAIAPRVRELIDSGRFDLVVATRDWHPPDHGSFEENGGPWPPHCVQGTPGAELHDSVPRDKVDVVLDKGQDPATDGYSAFDGTDFGTLLRERGVDRITLVGLATDYCVKNTALDALRDGFEVVVDRKGVRGIDVKPGDVEQAIADVTAAGGQVA